MNKNARRKHCGYKYDRAGRIIDGLIDNGRLILMIAFCLSVAFMMRSFPDAANSADDQSTLVAEMPESIIPASPGLEPSEPDDRIQERSDYRVELFTQCADKSYEEQNQAKCEDLLKDVDEAVEKLTEKTIKDKSSPTDGGTYLDTDSQPIVVAIRST